jgi:predicted nuclease of predicted toxin-antitoxin system
LRLVCDANIGSIIANALTAAGHDVVRATTVAPHAADTVILSLAVNDDRILITCDRDFGELVFLHGLPPPSAIIYIRFEPQNVGDIVPRLISVLDSGGLEGHITVIDTAHNRRTPFPAKSNDNG